MNNRIKRYIATSIAILTVLVVNIAGCKNSPSDETAENEVQQVNKYNEMGFSNVCGYTLEEYAKKKGYGLEEFKTQFALPEDMPGDTYFDAAYAMIPIRVIAAQQRASFEQFKEGLKIPDFYINDAGEQVEITEDLPWGITKDELNIEVFYSEQEFQEMKTKYGFSDGITIKSKVKTIRPILESVKREESQTDNSSTENAKPVEGQQTEGTTEVVTE